MPLTKQTLSLKFEKGLNQKASDRTLNVPDMANIKNARFEKTGELRRRYGLTPEVNANNPSNVKYDLDMTSGSEFTKCEELATYKDELLLFDGKNAYGQAQDNAWIAKGVCDAATIKNDVLRDDATFLQSRAELCKMVTTDNNTWLAAAYYETDISTQGKTVGSATITYNLYVQIYDFESMQEFGDRQLVSTHTYANLDADYTGSRAYQAPRPRVLQFGNYFVIIYNKTVTVSGTDTTHVRYRLIDMDSAPTLGAEKPSSTTSLFDTGKYATWDACVFEYNAGESGIALWYQKDSGTNSWELQEYKVASDELSTSGMRSVFAFTHSSLNRIQQDWAVQDPHPYGCFIRHVIPSQGADSNCVYVVGFNVSNSGVAAARFAVIDASGSNLLQRGSTVACPDGKGMLNGTCIPEPFTPPATPTHIRLYYTNYTINTGISSDGRPNDTALKSMRVQISDGAMTEKNALAFNTGLVSDPWQYNDSIYYVVAEAIAPKGEALMSDGGAAQLFSAGSTYLVRDDLDDTSSATYKRERIIPVAKTRESDVACTPYTNWFHLTNTITGVTGEMCANMYWGASPIWVGRDGEERLVGCASYYGQHLTGDQAVFNTSMLTVNHMPRRRLPSVEHNENLLVGGGFLKSYAGARFMENGFLRRPQIAFRQNTGTGAINGVTGAIEDGNTYFYRAIYEYIDESGNLHRSAPSDPMRMVLGGSHGAAHSTVKIYTYQHSLRHAHEVRVVLYRTLKDQTLSYRVGDIANDFDAETVSIIDTFSDAQLFNAADPEGANELLYVPGELANGSPGSIMDITVHKNRISLVQSDDRVLTTKPTVRTLACEPFSEGAQVFSEVEGGTKRVYGIESNGDHLIVFTSDSLFAISGEGPDRAGGTARFSEPRLLTKGQGSVEGTIHENTPAGIIYQSPRGFYVVNRELGIDYIGAPVEDFGVYRGIGALTNDERHEVYIVLGARLDEAVGLGGYSTVLVFNYFYGNWTQYIYDRAYVGYNSAGVVSHKGDIYFGRMRYASQTGGTGQYTDSTVKSGVWKEDTGSYWDQLYGSSPTYSKFSTIVESPYIHTNNLQGAQRVYKVQFLGEYLGDHDVTVAIKVDYDDTSSHSQTKTASTLTDKNLYRVHVKRQKCRALKITHTIAPNSSSTQANGLFKLAGMALEVGFRPTSFKLPAGDTI